MKKTFYPKTIFLEVALVLLAILMACLVVFYSMGGGLDWFRFVPPVVLLISALNLRFGKKSPIVEIFGENIVFRKPAVYGEVCLNRNDILTISEKTKFRLLLELRGGGYISISGALIDKDDLSEIRGACSEK